MVLGQAPGIHWARCFCTVADAFCDPHGAQVADIFCNVCNTNLGWKYEMAFEEGQKYKVGPGAVVQLLLPYQTRQMTGWRWAIGICLLCVFEGGVAVPVRTLWSACSTDQCRQHRQLP